MKNWLIDKTAQIVAAIFGPALIILFYAYIMAVIATASTEKENTK